MNAQMCSVQPGAEQLHPQHVARAVSARRLESVRRVPPLVVFPTLARAAYKMAVAS